jgi:hypothetical protein
MDVDKVERKLLALYKKMMGPGVWPARHVIEWDAFLLIIKACVFEFWFPTGEAGWVWRKKTWVDDEESLITGKVREQLEKAAGMGTLKARYSEAAQKDFDEIVRYVNWWYAAAQVEQEEKGETNGGNGDETVQLAALREFIDQWECEQ